MKKKIVLGVLAVILLTGAFIAWKFFGQGVRQPEKKYFYISTGETLQSVRQHLVDSNVIRGTKWFDLAANAVNYTTVKPGRYEIPKGMSLTSLVRMLKNGRQAPVKLVIIKFRTKESLAGRIAKNFETDSASIVNFLNNADSLRPYGLDTSTAMAAVVPLTYSVYWNTPFHKIFQEFHKAYTEFWNADRNAKAKAIGLTPVEVTTLASIIDEETNDSKDRSLIASVYLNRIRQGIPLQADPTTRFFMRDFAMRRVYKKYNQIPSPYNTYLNRGIPPGPICTPALGTVDAVLDAPKTDYLYFVASPALDGSSVFTTNLKDHLAVAVKYQAELNKRNIR